MLQPASFSKASFDGLVPRLGPKLTDPLVLIYIVGAAAVPGVRLE